MPIASGDAFSGSRVSHGGAGICALSHGGHLSRPTERGNAVQQKVKAYRERGRSCHRSNVWFHVEDCCCHPIELPGGQSLTSECSKYN